MNDITGRSTLRPSHRPLWRMLIIVAPLIIGVTFSTYAWYADRVVARREQTTSGTIIAHEPANHNRYGYTFSVNNQTYRGWQVPRNDEQFAIGQVVTVHYDPLDPNNSALVDFEELSYRASATVPLLVAVILFLVLFMLERRRVVRGSTSSIPS
jgi:Protein of unknown function (DUF3592)